MSTVNRAIACAINRFSSVTVQLWNVRTPRPPRSLSSGSGIKPAEGRSMPTRWILTSSAARPQLAVRPLVTIEFLVSMRVRAPGPVSRHV
jgi:hypothetical protein